MTDVPQVTDPKDYGLNHGTVPPADVSVPTVRPARFGGHEAQSFLIGNVVLGWRVWKALSEAFFGHSNTAARGGEKPFTRSGGRA